jgi:hypothetical protein
MGGASGTGGKKRNARRLLVRKLQGKGPLEYHNGCWRDRMGWCGLDWSG